MCQGLGPKNTMKFRKLTVDPTFAGRALPLLYHVISYYFVLLLYGMVWYGMARYGNVYVL